MRILISNGRIIDPGNNIDAVGDILIEEGRIASHNDKNISNDIDVVAWINNSAVADQDLHYSGSNF